MSKQEAMDLVFSYLVTHENNPTFRRVEVCGDDDGGWKVSFAMLADDREELAEGRGADFAEAFDAAVRDMVRINQYRLHAGLKANPPGPGVLGVRSQ